MRNLIELQLVVLTVASAVCCAGGRMKARDYFSDARVVALVETADHGDAQGVASAVAHGASPNATGKEGITPLLFVLASSRNKAGLRALLTAGADPNRLTADGVSPLVLAARADDPEFLKIMLTLGGNPNLRDASDDPVLQVAARDGRWENVQQLISHGADINGVDGAGYSILMNLVALGKFEQIAWLIQEGADVRVVARNGSTLAKCVKNSRLPPNSPQIQWRQKVVELMKERGVSLPN